MYNRDAVVTSRYCWFPFSRDNKDKELESAARLERQKRKGD
jgi:hypothetical protein